MSAPKPFNSINGKVIVPSDELRCRIAYATDETPSGWKFSCGDGEKAPSSPYKTHRTLREHIRRKDGHAPHDNWGDRIEIAFPTEVAAAARLPETPYIITRDDDDNVINRTGNKAPSSVQGPAPTPQASVTAISQPPYRSPSTFPAQPTDHTTMSFQPCNSKNGHVILPLTETRCRIVCTDPGLACGWRSSCGTSATEATAVLYDHQSPRFHLRGVGRFTSHMRDGNVLTSGEEVVAAEEPSRPGAPYILTKNENGDVVNRAGTAVPGFVQAPVSMGQAPASVPIPRVSISQAQPPPGFSPAQPSPRPGHLPRTRPLCNEVPFHLPRARPLYEDSDYPGVPREVHRLEHEPVGTYLVRGNYLYHETRNTLGGPTFRLHGIYERIDG